MSAEYLLPPDWMVRLERMSLGSAKRVAGTLQGKRRSSRLGSSLEFADYRPYAPGDDIRRFDWGVYARTGKPFVRQFMDEQELMVSLYVDCSASMDFAGGPGDGRGMGMKRFPPSCGMRSSWPPASDMLRCALTNGCRPAASAARSTLACPCSAGAGRPTGCFSFFRTRPPEKKEAWRPPSAHQERCPDCRG